MIFHDTLPIFVTFLSLWGALINTHIDLHILSLQLELPDIDNRFESDNTQPSASQHQHMRSRSSSTIRPMYDITEKRALSQLD